MEIEFALKEYGLTEKEVKTYIALLKLGNVNLQEIARRLNFPRTTVYNTLNYLHQKGLVSKIIKKGVTFFEAAEPKKIIDDLIQKKELLEKALPELESLKKSIIESSSVEIYEGQKGLSTILSDIFRKKQEVCYFGSYSLSLEVLKHQPEHFRTLRLEKKIPSRIIIESYKEEIFNKKEYKQITQMRFFNGLKDFPCMMFIYGEKVAIYTLKDELIGVIIKNKQVSQAIKLIFDIYWKQSKPQLY